MKRIELYQSLVSPVRNVPVEIWLEIFRVAACYTVWSGVDQPDRKPTVAVMHTPATTLRRVCKNWNNIVIATPKLWTYLVINSFQTTPSSVQKIAQKHLTCAGDEPLHVCIRFPLVDFGGDRDPCDSNSVLSIEQTSQINEEMVDVFNVLWKALGQRCQSLDLVNLGYIW